MSKWVYGYALPLGVIKYLHPRRGSLLLVVGAGMGQTAIMAARRFKCRVLGLEASPKLVEEARRRAGKAGLGEAVSFSLLSESRGVEEAETIFFETILSFVDDPVELINSYVGGGGEVRVGILEIVWLSDTPPDYMTREARKIFGECVDFKPVCYWPGVLKECRLSLCCMGFRKLGMARKFWDDFKTSPLTTATGIAKTLYKACIDPQAMTYMNSFRRFFKELSKDMACAYYIASKTRNVTSRV